MQKLLDSAKDAARWMKMHDFVRIISHNDADGIASAGILCHALWRSNIGFHVRVTERLEKDVMEEADCPCIICDIGVAQPSLIPKDATVIDHHTTRESLDAIHVNPHLHNINGSKELSASALAYLVSTHISGNNKDLAGLAIVGMLGDKQEMIGGNRGILYDGIKSGAITTKKGLKLGGGNVHDVVLCNPVLYPLFTEPEEVDSFLDELRVEGKLEDMDGDELKRFASALVLKTMERKNPAELIGDVYILREEVVSNAFDLVGVLDACGKSAKPGLALSLVLRSEKCESDARDVYRRFRQELVSGLKKSESRIESSENVYYLFIDGQDITSATANILMRCYTDRPLLVISRGERLKVSARVDKKLASKGLDLSVVMRDAAKEVGGTGGGHDVASGAIIPKGTEDEFIRLVDEIVSAQPKKS